jgi:hypothetical protein
MWRSEPHVPEKIKKYHVAAGERRHYWEQTLRLHAHRVRPVNQACLMPEQLFPLILSCASPILFLEDYRSYNGLALVVRRWLCHYGSVRLGVGSG